MSRHTIQESIKTTAINGDAEVLEIIKEEQASPAPSGSNIHAEELEEESKEVVTCTCSCRQDGAQKVLVAPEELESILQDRELKLREEYEKRLEKEIQFLRERFDFILLNEQTRASYMLREAHRERQEKITALQTQLECKNLAGLMYVMCAERRRSKLEKLRLIEEYTSYIHALQDILTEGQALILHLSRGYKTAARVDHEWRQKMKKIVQEFMAFIYNYAGGSPESNQYFFNLPLLLNTESSITEDPNEDPCEDDEVQESTESAELQGEKTWWERLEGDCRPFIMFGDMAEFKPNQRREVLKHVKAAKTAPAKWKEYVFNEMFLKAECPNADSIKDEYPTRPPGGHRWECSDIPQSDGAKYVGDMASRRATAQSIDIRGNMGSLLKIITSTNVTQQNTKTTLLGARDSMEIQSTTKLREKHYNTKKTSDKVIINIGKRTSVFEEVREEEEVEHTPVPQKVDEDDDVCSEDLSALGSVHNDSLQVIQPHGTDKDRINYEKVCPIEKCQRMQVDSFVRSLPPYMRANPYTHFEQNFDEYETCTPEQLQILKERIEKKQAKQAEESYDASPLEEWTSSVQGVMTQTSDLSIDLPPCTCNLPTQVDSYGKVFNVEDLIPVKKALESINKACFFDNSIDFDRFKVIGERSSDNVRQNQPKPDFIRKRHQEIQKILKQHPSLLDIFQANTRC